MRIPPTASATVLAAVLAGCGGTSWYEVEGGPPIADYRGKALVVKPFEAVEVQGMSNREASERAAQSFGDALFGGPYQMVSREKMNQLLEEKGLSDVEGVDPQKLGAIVQAAAVVFGKVLVCKESGSPPSSSEVYVSVKAVDVGTGVEFFRASQRAVGSLSGFGIGHMRLGKKPAQSAKELLEQICKNLAELFKQPPAGAAASPPPAAGAAPGASGG
ncbi:MAG: hypothetical protein L0216_11655 [Planctomycetales bacterium]|nr:hypothetical protein [Planctomycetales bacterium]